MTRGPHAPRLGRRRCERRLRGAAAIRARLAAEGVSGYRLVEVPFANMGLAVAGGNVAAAVLGEPWLTQSLLRGDGRLMDRVIGGRPFERMQLTVVVFSARTYRERPETARAYLRAHVESLAWIRANPDALRAILARRLDLAPAVGASMHLVEWRSDGRSDLALLDELQATLRDVGVLAAARPAARILDERLLEQALAGRR